MDLEKVFHMKGGLGATSYPKNSALQKRAADKVKHITLKTIERVVVETRPKSLGIADMGCSSGPNTLSNVKEFVGAVEEPEPEFRFYLNHLPTNDFNKIFQALPDFYRELKKLSLYIAHHFGQEILDKLFEVYGRLVDQELAEDDVGSISIVLALSKL